MGGLAGHGRERLRLGLIGAGWISSIHLEALDRLGRTTLVGVASARLERAAALAEPRRRRRLRRSRADARRAAAGRRGHRGPAVRVRRDLRGGRRPRDPVSRREAARRDGCRRAGSRRGRDRRPWARGGRRVPPALARAIARGPRPAGRQPRAPRHGPLERRHPGARLVASRDRWRRAGDRAGDAPLRSRPIARRRGGGRRRRVAPRDAADARRGRTSRTRVRRSFASPPARSGPSPTRAASRRPSSRSRSHRTVRSRRSGRAARTRSTGRSSCATAPAWPSSRRAATRTRSKRRRSSTQLSVGDPAAVPSTYADALRTDRLTRAVVAATGASG